MSTTRVHVIVEGPTEREFVRNLLLPALAPSGVLLLPHVLGKAGGLSRYAPVKRDILRTLKEDRAAYCTTMLDFFELPRDFPGMPVRGGLSAIAKARIVEQSLVDDIEYRLSEKLRPDRFLPYVQMHEFEGILFSAPDAFAQAIRRDDLARRFASVRRLFPTPEDINDGQDTAPSKRILKLYPRYQKVKDGPLAAAAIGLEAIRRECPHFNDWVNQLERLGKREGT
ncbi:MAG TPA: DUF4276 family protein [Armatimonadota bacterium]|nr:DUF4276 family protein [Armatimonadota bacterium]